MDALAFTRLTREETRAWFERYWAEKRERECGHPGCYDEDGTWQTCGVAEGQEE